MEVDAAEILQKLDVDPLYKQEAQQFWNSLEKLPEIDFDKFYRKYQGFEQIITQGDIISGLKYINLPDETVQTAKCLILSNTCDTHVTNLRPFQTRILYAPILSYARFKEVVARRKPDGTEWEENELESYLKQVRDQEVGQIFYIPKGHELDEDGVVFLHSIQSNKNADVSRANLPSTRKASMSMYGTYLLQMKLCLFFARQTEDSVQFRFRPTTQPIA